MPSVKIKSVSWKAKQIVWLGLIVLLGRVWQQHRRCRRHSATPERFRALVFTKTTGFRHDSIPQGVAAIRRLGRSHAFDVDTTADAGRFTHRNLARYDVVIFLQTTGTPIRSGAAALRLPALHPPRRRLRRRARGRGHARRLAVVRAARRHALQAPRPRPVRARGERRRRRHRRDPRPAGGLDAHRRVVRVPLRAGAPTCSRNSTSRVRWPGATATMAAARCTPRWVIRRSPTPSRSFVRHLLGAIEMAAGRARFACAR